MDADPGILLRRAREAAGLSVRQAAARLGLSPATISDAERGHDPRLSTLRAYVAAHPGLSPHALLGRSVPRAEAVEGAWRHLADVFGFTVRRLRFEVTVAADGTRSTSLTAAVRVLRDEACARRAALLVLCGSPAARAALASALDGAREGLAFHAEIEDACFVHAFRSRSWLRAPLDYERRQRPGLPAPEGLQEAGALALSAPFPTGISIEATVPTESLEMQARFEGPCPATAGVAAWMDGQALPPEDADLTTRLHVPSPRPRVSQRTRRIGLVVTRPLVGVQYGLGWGEGLATGAPTPRPAAPASRAARAGELRAARESAGLSQRALAERLAVSPATIAEAERGQDLRLSLLRRLAAELPALDPRAVLGGEGRTPELTREQAWETWRDLLGIEADEERKALVITADGDAHAACSTIRLRRVRPAFEDLRIRYSSVQATGKRLPTVLKAIEDAVAEEAAEGLRARVVARRHGRLIHEIAVPRHLAQAGASYSRRLFNARFFEPDADGEAPRFDGAAIVPFHPVRRLSLTVTFPPGRLPAEAWFGVHPRVLLDEPLPQASVASRLHPEGLRGVRDEAARTLSLSVDFPLLGFIYDVFWKRG